MRSCRVHVSSSARVAETPRRRQCRQPHRRMCHGAWILLDLRQFLGSPLVLRMTGYQLPKFLRNFGLVINILAVRVSWPQRGSSLRKILGRIGTATSVKRRRVNALIEVQRARTRRTLDIMGTQWRYCVNSSRTTFTAQSFPWLRLAVSRKRIMW